MTRLPNLELLMYQAKFYLDCDKKYMKKGRMIQNIIMGEKIISVGIHDRQEESNSG